VQGVPAANKRLAASLGALQAAGGMPPYIYTPTAEELDAANPQRAQHVRCACTRV
jgi:hypothetical protein